MTGAGTTGAGTGVGIIGLGVMGGRIARHFLVPEITLSVYDVLPDRRAELAAEGAHDAASPADVAARCDVVLTSLPTAAQVEAVLFGRDGLASGGRELVVIDLSTIGPAAARDLAERAAAAGITFLDAAVAQGHAQAEAGTLTILAGGDRDVLDRYRPLLDRIANAVFHFGPSGAGQAAKLAYNLSGVVAVAGAAEGVRLLRGLGGDLRTFLDMLETVDANFFFRRPARDALAGSFEPGFRIRLALKDLDLVLSEGEQAGLTLPAGAATREVLLAAVQVGFGDEHTSAMTKVHRVPPQPSGGRS
ncbi:2-hydroxy-3-oxopropionate reductase [Actinomadura sp. NBRC 104412]|uniref:NAD(P)-dependent oxidoreductase n=1 Tax=Actinomadura sp. NBRC 104412 TaxID=3032203 RepID=UPI0024A06801|nr:NAD(P)-dependent oxidoreductase [Actinomadura sp. NBRC 104412]GLZ07497.1 2-hydroxy-3-oxopropionate reductase [Actinomadura sp. NBRC 104412]